MSLAQSAADQVLGVGDLQQRHRRVRGQQDRARGGRRAEHAPGPPPEGAGRGGQDSGSDACSHAQEGPEPGGPVLLLLLIARDVCSQGVGEASGGLLVRFVK
ncbi:hypothetical protein [Sinomonas terrae]|uniref:Uncharacterized protein n=1 Tax=Sinomonas terrae TaxID=2908838 RepID=A0ABS9U3H5_9MICC|nr:hypothetical protein [Sinomonas terrae]MCH6471218.1 hypothetical protein [Sinomonas terrae]